MIDVERFVQDLTLPQREGVTHVDGPLLIVAGAGSGKTRVITRRVAYLISQRVPPSSILAITFTNKAAGEMKHRIGAVLGRQMRDFGRLDQPWPTICTFHSLCLRVLRHYAKEVGLPTNFSIYDAADQTKLIKDALKALDMSSTNFPPSTVHASISNAKNQLRNAEAFAQGAGDFYERNIARVYTKYQQLLEQNNGLDFDDLLLKTAHAFRDHPRVLEELQDRYRYILIDEYQDTNHAQYVIAHALALKHRNICVVGDPDQSIYAWRGADIRNILDFEQDYPDAKVVRLEQNYRSTKTVLEIASALIAHNTQRKEKSLRTENPQGDPATLYLAQDEHDEAQAITRDLQALSEREKIPWSGMAVFYRMNSLSRVMEDALRKANVPYQIARGVEFYNRKEIKDVLAYLRVVANPSDSVSLERIVNVPPRGLGDTSIKQMQIHATAHGISLWDALHAGSSVQGLSTRAVAAAKQFVSRVERWRQLAAKQVHSDDLLAGQKGVVQTVMEAVLRESGLEGMLEKQSDPEQETSPLDNVNELINAASEYDHDNPEGSLHDYLALVSLVSDADHMKGAGGAVTLMTLHAAKGLEFPVVAIIGLEEGVLPHSRARASIDELEEERRLCFVGITRAQQRLILSKAARRMFRGVSERTVTSPFLNEIPPDALKVIDRTTLDTLGDREDEGHYYRDEAQQLARRYKRGQLVRHPAHGVGKILEVSAVGQQTRAVIQFGAPAGRKTLILQYAQLDPVS